MRKHFSRMLTTEEKNHKNKIPGRKKHGTLMGWPSSTTFEIYRDTFPPNITGIKDVLNWVLLKLNFDYFPRRFSKLYGVAFFKTNIFACSIRCASGMPIIWHAICSAIKRSHSMAITFSFLVLPNSLVDLADKISIGLCVAHKMTTLLVGDGVPLVIRSVLCLSMSDCYKDLNVVCLPVTFEPPDVCRAVTWHRDIAMITVTPKASVDIRVHPSAVRCLINGPLLFGTNCSPRQTTRHYESFVCHLPRVSLALKEANYKTQLESDKWNDRVAVLHAGIVVMGR